jgi:hypothetical protein
MEEHLAAEAARIPASGRLEAPEPKPAQDSSGFEVEPTLQQALPWDPVLMHLKVGEERHCLEQLLGRHLHRPSLLDQILESQLPDQCQLNKGQSEVPLQANQDQDRDQACLPS